MKFLASRTLTGALLLSAFIGVAPAQGPPQPAAPLAPLPPPAPRGAGPDGRGLGPRPEMAGGTYTTLTGTISQFNYDQDAEIEGFLLSNNTLVQLPRGVAPKFSSSLHVGDSVTVTGMGRTSATGFQIIFVQSIKDTTSGKSLELPIPGAPAPFSGSGKIQQLNYGRGGEVNGFLLDNGVLAVVPAFSASNPSSIKVGATVSYSGYARRTQNEKTVVAVQSLTINGQQITLAPAGRSGGPDGGPGMPRARRGQFGQPGPGAPQAGVPPPAPVAPAAPGAPGGRLEEPPPPPPPPAAGDPQENEAF